MAAVHVLTSSEHGCLTRFVRNVASRFGGVRRCICCTRQLPICQKHTSTQRGSYESRIQDHGNASPICDHTSNQTQCARCEKSSPIRNWCRTSDRRRSFSTLRWVVEAVEAVEATQFCGGANDYPLAIHPGGLWSVFCPLRAK